MKLLVTWALIMFSSFALAQELESPASSQVLLVLPQPSPIANTIQPSIIVGGKVLKVSAQSSPEVRELIIRLFATTNAYSLHSQNAQFRRFSVQAAGNCFDNSKIVYDSFGFPSNDGRIECVEGAEIVLESLTPVRLRQPNDMSINDGYRGTDEDRDSTPSFERSARAAQQ